MPVAYRREHGRRKVIQMCIGAGMGGRGAGSEALRMASEAQGRAADSPILASRTFAVMPAAIVRLRIQRTRP